MIADLIISSQTMTQTSGDSRNSKGTTPIRENGFMVLNSGSRPSGNFGMTRDGRQRYAMIEIEVSVTDETKNELAPSHIPSVGRRFGNCLRRPLSRFP
jgi:hypothetical protein